MRPSAERVRELLSYDPETGVIRWRVSNSNRVRVGEVAGAFNACGYRVIGIDGKLYQASHLVWVHMTGYWPAEIDHRDVTPANNAWDNLRESTRSQNQANRRKTRNNRSGFKGVCFHSQTGKWRARLQKKGMKPVSLGLHWTREAAHAAYVAAAVKFHGEFAHG